MKLGEWGEEQAERYLRKKGYLVVEKNFRCRLGEIDIIAMEGAKLVFIEVKTRKSQSFGLPCEAVNTMKLRHIKLTAAYYMSVNPGCCSDLRLDVIEILQRDSKAYIRHLENITG